MYKPIDYIQQLANYIKRNLAKGYTIDALKFSLIEQGYSRISVEKAIGLANKQLAEKVPFVKEKPKITYKILDDENKPVKVFYLPKPEEKKGFWKRLFG